MNGSQVHAAITKYTVLYLFKILYSIRNLQHTVDDDALITKYSFSLRPDLLHFPF